jgi:hypothetical protein
VVIDKVLDGHVKSFSFNIGIHLKQKLTNHFTLRLADRFRIYKEVLSQVPFAHNVFVNDREVTNSWQH